MEVIEGDTRSLNHSFGVSRETLRGPCIVGSEGTQNFGSKSTNNLSPKLLNPKHPKPPKPE